MRRTLNDAMKPETACGSGSIPDTLAGAPCDIQGGFERSHNGGCGALLIALTRGVIASKGRTMKKLVLTGALLAALSSAALAHPGHQHKKPKIPAKKTAIICPVTGDKIASVKVAVG